MRRNKESVERARSKGFPVINGRVFYSLKGKVSIINGMIEEGETRVGKIARAVETNSATLSVYLEGEGELIRKLDENKRRVYLGGNHYHCLAGSVEIPKGDELDGEVRIVRRVDLARELARRGAKFDEVKSLIGIGESTFESFLRDTGLYNSWRFMRNKNLEGEGKKMRNRRMKIRPDIDELALSDKPPSLIELKKIMGIKSYEGARWYLKKRGIHEKWKGKREKLVSDEILRKEVVGNILQGVLEFTAKKEDSYLFRVVSDRVQDGHSGVNNSYESIVLAAGILRAHDELVAEGGKMSLYKIGKRAGGLYVERVRGVLRRSGIDPEKVKGKKYNRR